MNRVFPDYLGMFIAFIALSMVLPYASNGTVILVLVALLSRYNVKSTWRYLKDLMTNFYSLSALTLIIFGVLSSLWSVAPTNSLNMAARLFLLLAALGFGSYLIDTMPSEKALKLRRIILWVFLSLLVLYAIDIATNGGLAEIVKQKKQPNITKVGRGAGIFVVMIWAVSLIIYRMTNKILFSAAFIFAAGVVIFMLPMRAAMLAFITGLIFLVLTFIIKRAAIIILCVSMITGIITAPFVAQKVLNLETVGPYATSIPSSWLHRLGIWHYASLKIAEKPFFGFGLEASRTISETAPKIFIGNIAQDGGPVYAPALPLHPHNMAIQVWLELGFVGALLLCGLIFGIMRTLVLINNPTILSITTAMTASGFMVASFSFGIWQSWWLAGLTLAIFVLKIAKADMIPNMLSGK